MGVVTKSIFGNKPSGGSCKERHCHKPWFDTNYRITKRELKLWLKTNPDSHAVKHQESKLKIYQKGKEFSKNLQELNICVCLPRWMRFHSRKNTD